jgi:hypothetical protein
VAIFALAGPPLGGFVATMIMGWKAMVAMPELIPLSLLVTIPLSYILGLIPGLLIGLAAAWLSPRFENGWLWVGACALAAAAVAGLLLPLLSYNGDLAASISRIGAFAGGGAIAALVCGLICLGLRPKPA